MKLAIMQPYFFPYIGYLQLIQATDKFVFFDTPQYKRRSWMNRNRIINMNKTSTYITVPTVRAPQTASLQDIKIDNSQSWKQSILAQLEVYKKHAPFYYSVADLVRSVLAEASDSLVGLNISSVVRTCDYLGLPIDYGIFSHMGLDIPACCGPDEWALHISKGMGYDCYINAPGGMEFFDAKKYSDNGIALKFLQPNLLPYVQKIGRFEAGLSIIDVMMFNSVRTVRDMVEDYSLV